jgi:hypothetical protein
MFLGKISLLALLLIGPVGCGKKSTIKNDVKAEKLSCAYGDCRYIIKNLTFPLDDSSLAYQTPLPGLGPIAGGIIKFVGDIFAKSTDLGKMEMSWTQPIPEIPQVLKSVRLKRFFFYMKPVSKKKQTLRSNVRDWFNRYVLGRGHTTFAFLDKLAVRLSTSNIEKPQTYVPTLITRIENRDSLSSLLKVFSEKNEREVIDPEIATELVLLKYHKKRKSEDSAHRKFGKIHYLETTSESAFELKKFLLAQRELQGHFVRILLLGNSLLVELVKDPVSEEIFQSLIMEKTAELDQLGVNFIDTCTQDSCLEVNVPNVNIIPIATKGNSLKLDAFLQAADVPESFKLKGFVEFEAKVESNI